MGKNSLSVLVCALVLICSNNSKVVLAKWWTNAHIYEVYLPSFQDSNGDGIGDFNGLTARLSYIKRLKADAVLLSPIYRCTPNDFGDHVIDFKNVNSLYGTLAEFYRLLEEAHRMDLKVIFEYTPIHTSNMHPWFLKSRNPNDPEFNTYKDAYVWGNGTIINGTRFPPSNWNSVYNGSAWEWDVRRGMYYLHQFLPDQPELNYRNPKVVEEMKDVARFWLERGVDGFKINKIPYLFVATLPNGTFPNEPYSNSSLICPNSTYYYCYDHIYTFYQPDIFKMVSEWREVIIKSGNDSVIFTDACDISPWGTPDPSYFNTKCYALMQQYDYVPIYTYFTLKGFKTTPGEFQRLIKDYRKVTSPGHEPIWMMSSPNKHRAVSRYGGPAESEVYIMIIKVMAGGSLTYYGDEMGMIDVMYTFEETRDPVACMFPQKYKDLSHDPERSPMQWNNSTSAGFSSSSKPWLPVAPNYRDYNVELQESQGLSYIQNYRYLIELCNDPIFKLGGTQVKILNVNVMVIKRQMKKSKTRTSSDPPDMFVYIGNLGTTDETVCLSCAFNRLLPKQMIVAHASMNSKTILPGCMVDTKQVVLPPKVGLILKGKCNKCAQQ